MLSRAGPCSTSSRFRSASTAPLGDDTVLITRGDQDIFSLLVVPPDTAPEAARAAMAQAVRADNVTQANQILIDTRSAQVPPE